LKSRKTALPAIILFFCLSMVSCGKKAEPFLPVKGADLRVTGLRGEWKEGRVLLTGDVRDPAGNAGSLEGLRVYYAVYPWDQPTCEGCPIEYKGFQLFGKEVTTATGFACEMPGIERGNIYYFEARVVGQQASLGPASNRVRVEVPEVAK
jgi:hypothetical protein